MTTAEVPDILERIALIQREILNPTTGRACTAYENVPYVISSVDMPLFVNYAGPASQLLSAGSDANAREFNEIRAYTMILYHSPFGSGTEGEMSSLLTPFFPLVYIRFGMYPKLKLLAGIVDARLTGDSGMSTVNFMNQQYFGIKFTLQVSNKVRRLLGNYE